MPRHDQALLLDMLLACRKIQRFSAGLTRETLATNDMAQSAIVREFQVIGEAARMISEDTRTQHDQIPWASIAGLRNRVIHEYFRVDLDILWSTIEDSIPPLIDQLDTIVSADEEAEDA